jgi:transposase
MNAKELFIGVDVSKHHLDVAFGHLSVERIRNAPDQVARLVTRLQQLQPKLIVVESSGGYERTLMAACHRAQLPIALVQPQRVRAFAKATRQDRPARRATAGTLWGAHVAGGE